MQNEEAERQEGEQRHVVCDQHRADEGDVDQSKHRKAQIAEALYDLLRYRVEESYVTQSTHHRKNAEKTGQRLDKLFELIKFVDNQNSFRTTTGVLNDILARAVARVQPPSDKGKRLKIYYMTQISTRPPTFVAFCNDKELFHFSYQRYIENQIREVFGLEGTPLRLIIRERGE